MMRSVKNGFKSFFRKWKNSLTLTALIAVISCAIMMAALVLDACMAYKARTESPNSDYFRMLTYRVEKVGDSVDGPYTYDLNYDYRYTDFDRMMACDTETIDLIREYIYDITDHTAICVKPAKSTIDPYVLEWMDKEIGIGFLLNGVNDIRELTEFMRGEFSIAEGRFLESSDIVDGQKVCVISDAVSELNGVSVGDKIDIIESQLKNGATEYYTEEFTVIGIFKINIAVDYGETDFYANNLVENRIYVPYSAIQTSGTLYNLDIKLTDDDLIDDVAAEVDRYGLTGRRQYPGHFIRVKDIYAANNRAIHTLENAFIVVQYIFVAVAVFIMASFVYSVVISRKRELGIYLAIGYKKAGLVFMLAVEILLAATIGVILAFSVSQSAGAELSDAILSSALEKTSTEALAITTLETVEKEAAKADAAEIIISESFVKDTVLSSLALIIPIIAVSFGAAIYGILKLDVMTLLTKGEDA